MIKVRGWQVSPAELESTLRNHPEIVDAAVIGVTIPINTIGESPRAYITKSPDSALNEADIRAHMSKYLSAYKQLNGGIVFLDSISRTSTGKIDRKTLKERARVEIGEVKDSSVKIKINSAFRTLNHSVHTFPDDTTVRATQSFSGETAVEQDLRAVSKALENAFPLDSSSPSTTNSSNERTIPPSPTIASSANSEIEGETGLNDVNAFQPLNTIPLQQKTSMTTSEATGIAGEYSNAQYYDYESILILP